MNRWIPIVLATLAVAPVQSDENDLSQASAPLSPVDAANAQNVAQEFERGRRIFRYDTFGDEAFWGDTLRLHEAIAGAANGGVGPGVSPETALAVGLKVDVDALPQELRTALRKGRVDLTRPGDDARATEARRSRRRDADSSTTDGQRLQSVGHHLRALPLDRRRLIRAGHRSPTRRLGGSRPERRRDHRARAERAAVRRSAELVHPTIDAATVRTVLRSWGPGKFDAELLMDGKAFRPDGKSAATLLPPAFGLAGRQPAHLDRLGIGDALERLRRQSRDAGTGHLLRPAAERCDQVPDRRAGRFRRRAPHAGSRHGEARAAALLSAQPAGAAAARVAASTRRRQNAARRCSRARRTARAATCRRSTPSPAGTCTRRRRSVSTASRPIARRTSTIARRR